MHAYSMPITPPPTTIMLRGTSPSRDRPSESITAPWSVGIPRGRTGAVPVAITNRSAR